jgi:hypothetical protein
MKCHFRKGAEMYLNKDHIITALASGFSIYAGCLLGVLIKAPPLLLISTYLAPGILFGVVLTMTNNNDSKKKNFLIFALSLITYSLVIYLADIPDHSNLLSPPLRIITASILGALLLSVGYDFLINEDIQLFRTFVNPILIGILSSIISAFAIYKMDSISYDQPVLEFFNQMGIYSIFPIWQVLFIINMGIKN